ncbi:hypothetical protein D3C84_921440 [compost metagenome]
MKAVLPLTASFALLAGVLVNTWTFGSWLVSSSAVAVSRTRSMNRLLKLPITWPALARLPIFASMSLMVWV